MKVLLIAFLILSGSLFAQFRDQETPRPELTDGIISKNSGSNFLGFFDPSKFHMNHSYSLSYSSFGSNGLAVGEYTNSIMYQFADNLNVEVDASLTHTPYSSFGNEVADRINGVRLSRAEINYKPTDNVFISLQYNNRPYGYYSNPYSYYNPFYYRNSPWGGMFKSEE